MKIKKRSQPTGTFLLELILAILFFAIVSCVCVRFFVKSHIYSRDALRLNHSVSEISSVLEIAASAEDPETVVSRISGAYPTCSVYKTAGYQIVIWYDVSFMPCTEKDAAYCLYTDISVDEQNFLKTDCVFYTNDLTETIWSAQTVHHVQEVAAHAQ